MGGNSSLQLMYNLINIGYVFGFPESPCPWSQVEKRKFLCPVPGYDRHFAITEEFGFELISVPMTPDGPDMDIVKIWWPRMTPSRHLVRAPVFQPRWLHLQR